MTETKTEYKNTLNLPQTRQSESWKYKNFGKKIRFMTKF